MMMICLLILVLNKINPGVRIDYQEGVRRYINWASRCRMMKARYTSANRRTAHLHLQNAHGVAQLVRRAPL